MTLDVFKQLLELGWPALVTAMLFMLAKAYIDDQRKQIATLWERVATLEAELIQVKQALQQSHLMPPERPKNM